MTALTKEESRAIAEAAIKKFGYCGYRMEGFLAGAHALARLRAEASKLCEHVWYTPGDSRTRCRTCGVQPVAQIPMEAPKPVCLCFEDPTWGQGCSCPPKPVYPPEINHSKLPMIVEAPKRLDYEGYASPYSLEMERITAMEGFSCASDRTPKPETSQSDEAEAAISAGMSAAGRAFAKQRNAMIMEALKPQEQTCVCGHARSAHIYDEGACRPGFECTNRCKTFRVPKIASMPEPSESDEEDAHSAAKEYAQDSYGPVVQRFQDGFIAGLKRGREKERIRCTELVQKYCREQVDSEVIRTMILLPAEPLDPRRSDPKEF